MGPQSWPGPPQLGGLGGGCYVSAYCFYSWLSEKIVVVLPVSGSRRQSSACIVESILPTLWIMRLISLEAISRIYTPIILWLQEVDEQVRTDSGVKVGGF